MSFADFISQKKAFYDDLLQFIENDASENEYENLKNQIIDSTSTPEELQEFLHLLLKIYNNHQRIPNFFDKFDRLIEIIKDNLKETFSDAQIFNFFVSNKRLLLSLFNSNIITMNDEIAKSILFKIANLNNLLLQPKQKEKFRKYEKYFHFFYPEIKKFLNEDTANRIESDLTSNEPFNFESFNEKRRIGENDSYICSLIRNDQVEDFIVHVNRNNISPNSLITSSIFETNSILLKKDTTLIEYATFFGSIQIFKYLQLNNACLSDYLWIYAIHSRNGELIHLLEENGFYSKQNCMKESIKCHHNDIANYVQNEMLLKNNIDYRKRDVFSDNISVYSFHFNNYSFLPDDFTDRNILAYMCQYNYYTFVDILFQTKRLKFNIKIVLNQFF